MPAFDPHPVLFNVEENALIRDGMSDVRIQVCKRQIKTIFCPFSMRLMGLHDNGVRVCDIHGESLPCASNEPRQSDFLKFVILFGDMSASEYPTPPFDGYKHAGT